VAVQPLRTLIRHLRRSAGPPGEGTPTDVQLLDRWTAQRDEAAFELLLWRHGPMVLAACRRLIHDAHAAEDAFQASWLVFLRKANSLRRREAVAAWLHRVACRVALRARAAAARRGERERPAVDGATPTEDPEAERHDLRALLDEEIDRLPERYRRPFVLCVLQGRSHAEAARELGRPQGTVSSWLARARQRLRGRLTRRGVTLGAAGLAVAEGEELAAAAVSRVMSMSTAASGAGAVPATVAALAEGVLQAMYHKKLILTAGLLLAAVVVVGTGGLAYHALGAAQDEALQSGTDSGKVPAKEKGAVLRAWVEQIAKRVGDKDEGFSLLLSNGEFVDVDKRTRYLIETGDDARPAKLQDMLGKQVFISTERHGRRKVALVVEVIWPQPAAAEAARAFAWGPPHDGLRLGIAGTKDRQLFVALENLGTEDRVVNLGMMLANGKKQYPAALKPTLMDARGNTYVLGQALPGVAGRVDPMVVPLSAGGRYTVRISLAEWVELNGVRKMPGAGLFRATAAFEGKAVKQTNADSAGLALMPYWTGTLRSGQVELTLPAPPWGPEAGNPKKGAERKAGNLRATIAVNREVFHQGKIKELQLTFGVTNNGDKVIDPQIAAAKILVNGKALADSGLILGNGPRDARATALPPGESVAFSYALGDYFTRPGRYRVSWQGEGFRSPEIVFRVLAQGSE
jgi:RNA polymerase sigma factor (sigma-70 family)